MYSRVDFYTLAPMLVQSDCLYLLICIKILSIHDICIRIGCMCRMNLDEPWEYSQQHGDGISTFIVNNTCWLVHITKTIKILRVISDSACRGVLNGRICCHAVMHLSEWMFE